MEHIRASKQPWEMTREEWLYKWRQSAQTEQGIPIKKMHPKDAKNWLGYKDQKTLTVYRGSTIPRPVEAGDFVSTSKEAAMNYGKEITKIEAPIEYLRYVRGTINGNPKLSDIGGQTELIYAPKITKWHKKYKPWQHIDFVQQALQQGEQVPPGVLKDYPMLVGKEHIGNPTIPPELRHLAKEARKYGSAEEFEKNMVIHGANLKKGETLEWIEPRIGEFIRTMYKGAGDGTFEELGGEELAYFKSGDDFKVVEHYAKGVSIWPKKGKPYIAVSRMPDDAMFAKTNKYGDLVLIDQEGDETGYAPLGVEPEDIVSREGAKVIALIPYEYVDSGKIKSLKSFWNLAQKQDKQQEHIH